MVVLTHGILLNLVIGFGFSAITNCPEINPDPRTQCSCTDDIIDCSNRYLNVTPTFKPDNGFHELRLDRNNIEYIAEDAFKNLHVINRIFLQQNNISTIDVNAFRGLEPSVQVLNLADNSLTVLPKAIAVLTAITWLDVSFNPINESQFDEYTLYELGDTIKIFEFGSNAVHSWPLNLRHLQALERLNVTEGMFYTLPPDAFHGFEGTLTTLSIQNTRLIAIPLALSRLRFLDRLYFDHNHDIGDSGVLIPSFGNTVLLQNLKFISLIDDNLTVFPSLLQYLRNVEKLVLDSNRLAFISDTSVQVAVGTKLTELSLKNCSLSRVPGALKILTNLTVLDLAQNQIRSFENNDFDRLKKLTDLIATQNPLEFIGNETFKDLLALQTLDFQDTNIKTLPEAIQFLRSLATLKLPIDKIDCTCNIVWLKQFMDHCNRALSIDGSCETINTNVDRYLNEFIPTICPNYSNVTTCL